MEEFETDTVSEKLHGAISKIVSDAEGAAMVTKWICLAEVIDEQGDKSLWSLGSHELSMWDRIGMVEFHSRGLQPERE
jgi:hypothetical protein